MVFPLIHFLILYFILTSINSLPLREYANRADITLGCVINPAAAGSDLFYVDMITEEFDLLVAEYGCKMKQIQNVEGVFDYDTCDEMYNIAETFNLLFKGVSLFWHSSIPDWLLLNTSKTKEEKYEAIVTHVRTVVDYYEGKFVSYGVVNEAFDHNGVLWTDPTWPEPQVLIDGVFNVSRESDPNAKLFYNDFNIAEINDKSDGVYNMSHLKLGETMNWESVFNNYQRFVDLGLEVQLSELDCVTQEDPCNVSCLNKQAEYYANITEICMRLRDPDPNKGCKGILLWGFTDKYTWKTTAEHPCLWDENYNEKPAYHSFVDVLSEYDNSSGSNFLVFFERFVLGTLVLLLVWY